MDGKCVENSSFALSNCSPLLLAKVSVSNGLPSPMPSPLLGSHPKLNIDDSNSILLLQKAGVLIEPVSQRKMVDSPPSSPKVPKEEESDSDGEISNIDFNSQVNLRVKKEGEEQERPMSWEGELSDQEKDDCNMDTTNPGSPPRITSELKKEETIRPPLLPPPSTIEYTPLPLTERILGFTPTHSPLQARHHGKNTAPTPSPDSAIHSAYYSPTQSPVQSRHHLSGFSSPYSHRTTPSLSRNNSDASQYGGSQHSYSSSTTSPISPTQFSPTHSPVQSRHAAYSSPVLARASDYTTFGRDLPGSPLTRHHGFPPSLSLHRLTEEDMQAFAQQQQQLLSENSANEDELSHDGNDEKLIGSDLMQHSALAAQTGISRQQLINSPCPICGDKISGFHYGIFSCESCKGFFKRTVQNRKNYVCLRGSACPVTIATRKKCPACRFDKCLKMGMKLEAIREDRTRGGRSTYQCSYTLPSSLTSGGSGSDPKNALPPTHARDEVKVEKHEEEVKEVKLPVPTLLLEIMDVEHLWQYNEHEIQKMSSRPEPVKVPDPNADYLSNLCNIADHRLYKIVKWCKSLPLFKNIQVDDQTSLLINAWCELLLFSCCFRSMATPGEIRISLGKSLSLEEAHSLGLGSCIERMLNFTDNLRRLKVDKYEYVAMKVIVLLASDASGLKEPDKVRSSQEKVLEALQQYTLSHYPHIPSKFGELLLRIPDLQRTCHIGKEMLSLKSKEGEVTSFNLLMELLRGDH